MSCFKTPSPLDEMEARGELKPVSDEAWLAKLKERHENVTLPKLRKQAVADHEAREKLRKVTLL